MSDKYAAIAAERHQFSVRMMCRALDVSVGGFYDAQRRLRGVPTARVAQDEQVRLAVRVMFTRCRARYGAPRLHRALRKAGTRVAKHRVARVMREDQLVARPRRRFVRTTDSTHTDVPAPNLLTSAVRRRDACVPDRVWVSDMTYVPTRSGWLFLAIVLDLVSRRGVGWAMGPTMDVALPLAALRMALATRRPAAGWIHHSDRGSQPECNRSSQQSAFTWIVRVRRALRQGCAIRASCAVAC